MADKFTAISLGGKACIDADPSQYPGAANLANGYYCPLGPEAGIAHALMLHDDLDALREKINDPFRMAFDDGVTALFKKMYFINAVVVSGGVGNISEQVYLVKLGDPRYLLNKFGGTVNKGYNYRGYVSLRDPDETDLLVKEDCYRDSLDSGGDLWTWQAMLSDLWGMLPTTLAGDAPTLPRTPDGYPEGFLFTGESTWKAINGILDLVNMAIRWSPFDGTFSVVDLIAVQDDLNASLSNSSGQIFNAAPFWSAVANYPAKVSTHFPEGTTQYGSLNDTTLTTTGNFLFNAEDVVSIDTSRTGAISSTKQDLYDERQIRNDDATLPLTDMTVEATARKSQWLLRQEISESYARMELQGVVRIQPGSQIKAVYWRNWGGGTITEIARFPGFASAAAVYDPYKAMRPGDIECRKWLDVARKSKPIYPHVAQWVLLGDGVPNEDGLYEGVIQRGDNGYPVTTTWSSGEQCFIRFESPDRWPDFKIVLRKGGERFLGRINGSIKTAAGETDETRPLVCVQEYLDGLVAKPLVDVTKGSLQYFTVWTDLVSGWAAVSAWTIEAFAIGADCQANKYAKLEYVNGAWIAGPLECPE